MPAQTDALNTDTGGKLTSHYFGNRGDGTSNWFGVGRIFNGGDVAQGATSDAAVTNPASSGSLIALAKGLLTILAVFTGKIGTLTNSTSTALEQTRVVKASAGTLYGIQGHAATAGFVWVCNKTSAPNGTGDNLILPIKVAEGPFSIDFGTYGRAMATGIALGFSSTATTWTGGGSNMWVDAQYV
jgi:hypothetical protein